MIDLEKEIDLERLKTDTESTSRLYNGKMMTLDDGHRLILKTTLAMLTMKKELDKLRSEFEEKVDEFTEQVGCSNLESLVNSAVGDFMYHHDFSEDLERGIEDAVDNWMGNFNPSEWDFYDKLIDTIKEHCNEVAAHSDDVLQEFQNYRVATDNEISAIGKRVDAFVKDNYQPEHNTINNCVLEVRSDKVNIDVTYTFVQIEGKLWAIREELIPGEEPYRSVWPAEQKIETTYKCWRPD